MPTDNRAVHDGHDVARGLGGAYFRSDFVCNHHAGVLV